MPIQAQPNPLPQEQQQRLLPYLRREESVILLRVIEAKAITLEAEAHADTLESGEYEKFTATALAKLKEAQKYRHCILVLKELQSEDRHFTVNLIQT